MGLANWGNFLRDVFTGHSNFMVHMPGTLPFVAADVPTGQVPSRPVPTQADIARAVAQNAYDADQVWGEASLLRRAEVAQITGRTSEPEYRVSPEKLRHVM